MLTKYKEGILTDAYNKYRHNTPYTKEMSKEEYKIWLDKENVVAYEEIAKYKWQDGYKCRSCYNDKYFKGKSPFSRRCSICKKDESATACTAFDKLRIPIGLALQIVKLQCDTTKKGLQETWNNGNKVDQDVILKKRIYKAMKQEPIFFDKDVVVRVVFMELLRNRSLYDYYGVLIAIGYSKNILKYYGELFNKPEDIPKFVEKNIKKGTRISVLEYQLLPKEEWYHPKKYAYKNHYISDKWKELKDISHGFLKTDYSYFEKEGSRRKYWENGYNPYLDICMFKNNEISYEEFMPRLTKDYDKYK